MEGKSTQVLKKTRGYLEKQQQQLKTIPMRKQQEEFSKRPTFQN